MRVPMPADGKASYVLSERKIEQAPLLRRHKYSTTHWSQMEVTLGGMTANVDIRCEGQRCVNAAGTEEGRQPCHELLVAAGLEGPKHQG